MSNLYFRVLARGDGELAASVLADGVPLAHASWKAASPRWQWFDVPVPAFDTHAAPLVGLTFRTLIRPFPLSAT